MIGPWLRRRRNANVGGLALDGYSRVIPGMAEPALSFIIPLHNSATTIGALARDIEALEVAGGHEIVLVNDGSTDVTGSVCSELVRDVRVPVVYVEHTRNFG